MSPKIEEQDPRTNEQDPSTANVTNVVNTSAIEVAPYDALNQDPETRALLIITQCLNTLDYDQRERVMAYAIRRYWNSEMTKNASEGVRVR